MDRREIRELLLHGPRTEETWQRVPPDFDGLWFCKPDNSKRNMGRNWMYIRAAIFLATGVYVYFGSPSYDELRALFFVLLSYEIAYNLLWKEKMDLEQRFEWQSYERSVEDALDEHFRKH